MIRLLGAAAFLLALAEPAAAAGVQTAPFGTTRDGRQVDQVTLTNDAGMTVRIISYGAAITEVVVPDREGRRANVALGFSTFPEWEAGIPNTFFGTVVGRFAGRIEGARFTVDGREVRLTANEGSNARHGGGPGFESRIWSVRTFEQPGAAGAVLGYTSPAGEQGFPGELAVTITYRLTDDTQLRIDYEAVTSEPTALNLTNHSYFNLAGVGAGTIEGHEFQIFAARYVAVDEAKIPTGSLQAVAGTVYDFTRPRPIGRDMDEVPPLLPPGGYDHSWYLDKPADALGAAASIRDPVSGRTLDVFTTEPTLHVYTADHFDGSVVGPQSVAYGPRSGFALETQHVPISPNIPDFPSTVLRPGETFRSTTIFRFGSDADTPDPEGDAP